MCLTATYFETYQQCALYSVSLDQGVLRVIPRNLSITTLTFTNKSLSSLKLSSSNDTIHGIWNTTIGGDSQDSVSGLSVGSYPPDQGPSKAFDQSSSTKYVGFGTCNATVGGTNITCGENTGLYISLQREPSLLIAFRFQTPDSYRPRDPKMITIEGSNQLSSLLNYGSSWSLIYNGTSGLDIDPDRYSFGKVIWITNNTIRYSSYRLLVQHKQGEGNFVQYSEFQLFVI